MIESGRSDSSSNGTVFSICCARGGREASCCGSRGGKGSPQIVHCTSPFFPLLYSVLFSRKEKIVFCVVLRLPSSIFYLRTSVVSSSKVANLKDWLDLQ